MHWEERILLGIVAVVSALMLKESFQYAPEAQHFPQAAAILSLVFVGAVLAGKTLGIQSGESTDLVGKVQEKSELDIKVTDDAVEEESEAEIGKADLGEFRIELPTAEYDVPFTTYAISRRLALAVLLLVYLGLFWLFGAFFSSIAFFALYAKVFELRWTVIAGLTAFLVASLLVFGVWLETPLFRPAHELFTVPGVGL